MELWASVIWVSYITVFDFKVFSDFILISCKIAWILIGKDEEYEKTEKHAKISDSVCKGLKSKEQECAKCCHCDTVCFRYQFLFQGALPILNWRVYK